MGDTGKGGSSSSPPVMSSSSDSSGSEEAMMGMMAMMMETMNSQEMPQAPAPIATPVVERTAEVDWTEKMGQLASKAKADFTLDKARRKGRMDTIHTSPLLDDEDVTTTSSL